MAIYKENEMIKLYTDKDAIKSKMLELLQKYEDLDNLDMSKLAFHSYIIDVLSMLTSDNLFYSSMAYKNNFMIIANLQEAIYNWAKYLSYDIPMAKPSFVDSIIYFSNKFIDENVEFKIPKYHKFYAGDIIFRNEFEIQIKYENGNIKIKAIGDNITFYLPFEIEQDVVKFPLLLNQYNIEDEEIYVASSLKPLQFQSYKIKHKDYLYKLEVMVRETDAFGNTADYIYEPADNLYSMTANERKYVIKFISDNEFELLFGNGVYGKQLLPNSIIYIKKFTTKGDEGRIIKGALNSMDRIYATVDGIQKVVDLKVINPTNGVGGKSMEKPIEIKENAIRAFRSKLSLTTEPNYNDFIKIMNLSSLYQTKAVLKRSDLKINEINLFHVLKFSKDGLSKYEYTDIVPTNTLTITFPAQPLLYLPFKEFYNYKNEGFDYLCPFGISIDEKNLGVDYIYYIRNVNIISSVTNYKSTEYPIVFKNLNVFSNNDKSIIYFDLYYEIIDNTIFDINQLEVLLDIKYVNTYKRAEFIEINTDHNKISFKIESNELDYGSANLFFRGYYDGTKFAEGGTSLILLQKLDQIVYSIFRYENVNDKEHSNKIIYDIPVIEKEWWNSLTEEEKQNFEYVVIQQFLGMNLEEKRALNVRINNKFIKTIGKINNYFYNKESFKIISIVKELPDNPNIDDRYIISKETTDPNLIDFKNYIAIWDGNIWIYLPPETNSIILNEEDGLKYTYTGIRWFNVDYSLNLPIDISIFVDPSIAPDDETIKEEIKKTIVDGMVSKFGPDQPIYRSDIIYLVSDRKDIGVIFCELNIIETDMIFEYNIDKDLTKEQLIGYVPEFIHINPEDIKINIRRIKNPGKLN